MSDSVDRDILNILSKHAKLEGKDLTPATKLENIGVDSLLLVEIIFDLEEHFDISIPDPDFIDKQNRQFETAADVVRVVKELIQEQRQTP